MASTLHVASVTDDLLDVTDDLLDVTDGLLDVTDGLLDATVSYEHETGSWAHAFQARRLTLAQIETELAVAGLRLLRTEHQADEDWLIAGPVPTRTSPCRTRTRVCTVTAVEVIRNDLAEAGDPGRAEAAQRYFQVRPGGYGYGDRFIGVPVPVQRRIAARHWRRLPITEAASLLTGGAHEERLTAIFVLVRHFRAGDADQRRRVFDVVLAATRYIDNWDLVDSVAPSVVGPWLADRDRSVLDRLAGSASPWERRMAVVATLAFIREGDFDWTFRLAARLLEDRNDLVRKAVGWTLREVGNRDRTAEEAFLVRHHAAMPRVMLRYAIEKFDPERRRRYLTGDL